jgi:hypothetical protein
LAEATFDTRVPELGLGTRAANALDRANILTVEDLLTVPMRRLLRLRGVGNKTRREIGTAVRILRERLGRPNREPVPIADETEPKSESLDVGSLSVDLLVERILKTSSREGESVQKTLRMLLGLDPAISGCWPSQSDVARRLDVTRARVGQIVGTLQSRWSKDPGLTKLRSDLAEIIAGQGGVMSVAELIEAVLLARGSSQDEPRRTQLAGAAVRAALEAERTVSEPRLVVRRDGGYVLVGRTTELTAYARRLGDLADAISAEDPLVAPPRVIERLREVPAPAGADIADTRLVRLAATASGQAAVSSRQELYSRGMAALRALKLSQGALVGLPVLTVDQIRERVSSRYPQAEPLPERPGLDDLIREAGFEYRWDETAKDGLGCYVSAYRDVTSVTTGSEPIIRFPTISGRRGEREFTPEEADARQFEEKLKHAIKEGSFLSLLVNPKHFDLACNELCRRFPVELIDFEGLFLDALQDVANKAKVDWDVVLKTDANRNGPDWDKLLMLVGRAMPTVEQRLLHAERTMLVIYAGPLARYDQIGLLSRLSQKVGRKDGIPGLWLLLPGDNQALLDGKPVPLIGPGQRARIPESWLQNVHRGNGNGVSLA